MTACMLEKLGPLVPAQPMKLDAWVVANRHQRPKTSLERCWYLAHIGRLKRMESAGKTAAADRVIVTSKREEAAEG